MGYIATTKTGAQKMQTIEYYEGMQIQPPMLVLNMLLVFVNIWIISKKTPLAS
jgi:hypothetical protein